MPDHKQHKKIDLSTNQVSSMLEKHSLETLQSCDPIYGNLMNSNFEITTVSGDQFILKVQHKAGGHSLTNDYIVSQCLKDRLPIAPYQILDTDLDVISYPFLLSSKLPGELGCFAYEKSDHAGRLAIARGLGQTLAAIHSLETDGAGLKNLDTRHFMKMIEDLLCAPDIRSSIEGMRPGFHERLKELSVVLDRAAHEDPPTLIWRDPFFYNMLVDVSGDTPEITGVYDFQSAAYGSRQLDLERVRRGFDFQATRPRAKTSEAYADPAAIEEVWRGYEETFPRSSNEGLSQDFAAIAEDAYEIRYDWEAASRYPLTAARLENFLNRLSSLA
jgi:Ser/Thr protein kinase RdoA (MazF antagonist)